MSSYAHVDQVCRQEGSIAIVAFGWETSLIISTTNLSHHCLGYPSYSDLAHECCPPLTSGLAPITHTHSHQPTHSTHIDQPAPHAPAPGAGGAALCSPPAHGAAAPRTCGELSACGALGGRNGGREAGKRVTEVVWAMGRGRMLREGLSR
jgi:hypothetical protein